MKRRSRNAVHGNNRTSLAVPVGNETTWVYDGLDRVVEETNSLAASRTYSYDALNRVVEFTDRRGLVTQFDYDFWGRLVEETWLDGVTTVNVLEYRYDLGNNLLEADDDASAFDFTYDNLSRLLTSVDASGGPTVRLSQTWDGNSNRAALEAEIDSGGGYAADFLSEYTFDNLSRMTRVEQTDSGAGGVDVSEKRVDFAYNAVNQFTTITRYEDLAATDLVATSTYSYDNAHRLTALTHAKGLTTLADYDWTYDVSSRVTSFTNNLYSSETATYSYDHTDQLTGADRSGGGNDEAYSFDVNGNPTDSGWTVDDDNLLTSDGTYNYAHDDEGNTVKRTNISTGAYVDYFYDHRNRLVKAEFRTSGNVLTKRVELEYDVFDRLILKRLDANGNGSFEHYERFVYDSNNLALAFVDLDGQGSSDDYTLGNRYLHGPAVDQLLADEQFDAAEDLIDTYWTLGDNLGSIRDIANYNPGNDTTAIVNHRAFDSFGELLSETSPAPTTRFYFTARYFDHDLQLQYNHHRWYDPQQRRWMHKDPITFGAGDTNLSRMVGNNVTNLIDPDGLQSSLTPAQQAYYEQYMANYRAEADAMRGLYAPGGYEAPGFWDDPLEYLYGIDGAICNAAEYGGFQAQGAAIHDMLGQDYLINAGGWELFGLSSAAVVGGVLGGFGGGAIANALGWSGYGGAALAGGVGGGAEYLTWTVGSEVISGGDAAGPTLSGLGTHVGFGAAGGVVLHGASQGIGAILPKKPGLPAGVVVEGTGPHGSSVITASGPSATSTVTVTGPAATGSITATSRFPASNAASAALAEANIALAQGAKPGSKATGFETWEGIFTGRSTRAGGGPLDAVTQADCNSVPPSSRSPYHGKCAEPRAISAARAAGADPVGGTSVTVTVGGAGHGTPTPACRSCQWLLDLLDIFDGVF